MAQIMQHVVLVGLMGVGKTSIGKKIARQLELPFIDVDQEIERRENMAVKDIFATQGEDYFRQCEHTMLHELLNKDVPHIIAAGGGLFVDEENRNLIKQQHAISVWIQVDVDILVERCARKDTRPLLLTGDPKEILESLKEKRYPFYQQADIHVHGGNGPVSNVINRIIELVKEHQ